MRHHHAQCVRPDSPFYEEPWSGRGRTDPFGHRVPPGWTRRVISPWTHYFPAAATLPDQGWKIHVSATPETSDRILDAVFSICVDAGTPFKHLATPSDLVWALQKTADRGSSGKFVTIYPVHEDRLQGLVDQLEEQLGGLPGPYILSDLRWRRGPVHLRYGGFRPMIDVEGATGRPRYVIRDPGGNWVEDVRGPQFVLPSWAPVPEMVGAMLRERTQEVTVPIGYDVRGVLHMSNTGGVYRCAPVQEPDRHLVMKEARPWTGADASGEDAVTRLRSEAAHLRQLSGLGVTPELVEVFEAWEHVYMVTEYVEGMTLSRILLDEFPGLRTAASKETRRRYFERVTMVCDAIDRALSVVHSAGLVFGDLQPGNVIVGPDERVTFVDLESAHHPDASGASLGVPGFAAPAGLRGLDRDAWASACLRLHVVLPLAPLSSVSVSKFAELLDELGEDPALKDLLAPCEEAFALDPRFRAARRRPGPRRPADARRIMRGILASRAPGRPFPGDVGQFHDNGDLSLAHGLGGVAHALARSGSEAAGPLFAELCEGLSTRDWDVSDLGLCRGVAGVRAVAVAGGVMGPEQAWQEFSGHPLTSRGAGWSLAEGTTGTALHLCQLARAGVLEALAPAVRLAQDACEKLLGREHTGDETSRRPGGLLLGASGVAYLCVHLARLTGDAVWQERAARLLHLDLLKTTTVNDVLLLSADGGRALPYLAAGVAGVGLVALEWRRTTGASEFDDLIRRAADACRAPFTAQAGLFGGRAGMLLLLGQARELGDGPWEEALTRQRERLRWHEFDYADGVLHAGDQLLRLSSDLATGSAGVLLALRAVGENRPDPLAGVLALDAPEPDLAPDDPVDRG
ncbi:class III lanthionine synthetase LanKC [Cellulomonas triticagri]|uniref:Protein kinase domain-containing protein n=1 Tax=Cellulomonas triticagri TaxID=2483352 RepID=A0A3M2JC31_9CELL|nr:class III lanthionine synthetase LanKC [Cellulomonas triticagri]RMI09701.1 hypothetical protein EBM89_09285 [Cellulomonas triticagri]